MCDRSERYDRVLGKTLSRIVRERCLTSSQIKEFVSAPDGAPYRNFLIDVILKLKPPVKKKYFSSEQLRKLSPLWILVLGRCDNSVELLVRCGADVNELFGCNGRPQGIDHRWTVLHGMLELYRDSVNERIVRLIVDHGADLQAQDSNGRTVLHMAVEHDLVQIAEMLLEKGADVQARDFRIRTALHMAATDGRVQMVEMLLEKGADVNVADDKGKTPLLEAANSSKADELVPLLVKHGADVLAKDLYGYNILHHLPENRGVKYDPELVRGMIEKGVSLDDRELLGNYQPIHQAAMLGDIDLINLYSDYGADVNAFTCGGIFPLLVASQYRDQPAALETLLKRGANIDQRSETDGRTALHDALMCCRDGNIKVLLFAGADLLIEDHNGETPFALIVSMGGGNVEYPLSMRLMLKFLALKRVCQPTIELKDERIIEQYSGLQNYYRDCIEQLERTKSTRFIESCTFFDLLAKCHCQIAALMRNPEFEINFRNYVLTKLSTYAEVIVRAFERAKIHHQSMLEQEDVINEAVYGILPYIVVRKVAHYSLWCRCKG